MSILEKIQSIKSLYILMALGAAVGIISGIGSTCVTFDARWWTLSAFSIVEDYQMIWIICYFVTWLVGILWVVLYWALKSGKSWFYNVSIVNCILGFFSGAIPSILLFYEDWASYGESGMKFTPSWFRAIGNVIILLVLLLPKMRSNVSTHMAEKVGAVGGSIGSQVANFALVVFSFGVLLIIQPIIMPMTHPIPADVYMYTGYWLEAFQYYVGLTSIVLGIILRFVGQVLNIVYTPKSTPTKV
ncbi:MAG: hypothetical protein ACW98I_17270 [Candidatus Hodarchaeales archaeon]